MKFTSYQCDKCKKSFEGEPHLSLTKYGTPVEVYDLCSDCVTLLFQWIRGLEND